MIHAQSTIDETASTNVFNQLSELIFGNMDRSLRINRLAPTTHRVSNYYLGSVSRERKINNYNAFNDEVSNGTNFRDSDRTVLIDCKIENDKVKTFIDLEEAFAKEKKTNQIKYNMLVSKILSD